MHRFYFYLFFYEEKMSAFRKYPPNQLESESSSDNDTDSSGDEQDSVKVNNVSSSSRGKRNVSW